MLLFWSIRSGRPRGGAARWGAAEALADAAAHADGGGRGGVVEVESVGVDEPGGVAQFTAEADGEGLAGFAPASAVAGDRARRPQVASAVRHFGDLDVDAAGCGERRRRSRAGRCIGGQLTLLDDELAALGAQYLWAALDEVRELFERTALASELPLFFTPDACSRHLVRHAEAWS